MVRLAATLGLAFVVVMAHWPAATAQDWLLIETRRVPNQCSQPVECIDRSVLLARNMAYLSHSDRDTVTQFLNQIATIRGIPDDMAMQSQLSVPQVIETLHPLPMSEKLAPLVAHPGAYFDPETLDGTEATAGFGTYVATELQRAGFRILTEAEMEVTPGRPKLRVRFSKRSESAGCIIPFSISMSISEEVAMVRNPALKLSANAWSKLVKENLANSNYTPRSALEEAVKAFVSDWQTANSS